MPPRPGRPTWKLSSGDLLTAGGAWRAATAGGLLRLLLDGGDGRYEVLGSQHARRAGGARTALLLHRHVEQLARIATDDLAVVDQHFLQGFQPQALAGDIRCCLVLVNQQREAVGVTIGAGNDRGP